MTTGAVSDDRDGTQPVDGGEDTRVPGAPLPSTPDRGADPGDVGVPTTPASGAGAEAAATGGHRPRPMAPPLLSGAGPAARSGPAGGHPRPASRRGRAAVRRRPPVASPVGVPGAVGAVERAAHEPAASSRGRATALSRWPLPTDPVRRRRALLLAGMGALTLAGAALAVTGLSAVRTSTVGRYEQTVGPDDPGYQAYVVPTPTMGVLHRAADGTLAGAALVALEPGDEGGSVIVVPPATIVPGPDGETTIAAVFRDQGAAAAAQSLGVAATVGVSEFVEIDDTRWADLVAPVGPVEVSLDGAVGEWPAGPVSLEPDEVGPFLSIVAEGESDLDRLGRQQLFWDAWLPLVGRGGSGALPGEVDTGIGRFVRAVAQGGGTAAPLPVGRDDSEGNRFRPDRGRVGEFVSRTVPYPLSAVPGDRIKVRLLNGTRDGSLTGLAARALVAGGAEIAIAGNASTLDVADTSLVHTGGETEALATWLQAILGGGRVDEASTGQDGQIPSEDEIDVTVILGDDAGDLIGR